MTTLWLWRDGDRFIGYTSEFPTAGGGDPAVLGEPVARVEVTLLKPRTKEPAESRESIFNWISQTGSGV